MGGKRFRPNTDHLIERYRTLGSVKEMCSEFGVSYPTMRDALRAAGVTIVNPLYLKGLPVDDFIELHKSGIGAAGIAKQYGVSASVVARKLKARGYKVRDRSAQQAARMKRLKPAARKANAAKAHAAKRGVPNSHDALVRAAITREARQTHRSPDEIRLCEEVAKRGYQVRPQKAVDRYNCDLVVDTVAVEVFGGGWHWHGGHLLRSEERFRRILDAGYDILVVASESRRHPIDASVTDYVCSYIDLRCGDPSRTREYRVIRGAGELLTCGSADDDNLSIIPALKSARDPRTGRYKSVPR